MTDAKTPYYTVKSLLMNLLGFHYDTSHQERERSLFNTFSNPFIIENMCLLNDLLQLKVTGLMVYIGSVYLRRIG